MKDNDSEIWIAFGDSTNFKRKIHLFYKSFSIFSQWVNIETKKHLPLIKILAEFEYWREKKFKT